MYSSCFNITGAAGCVTTNQTQTLRFPVPNSMSLVLLPDVSGTQSTVQNCCEQFDFIPGTFITCTYKCCILSLSHTTGRSS
jgi:hypothetical protein